MKMSKLNERLILKSIKHWEEMRDDPSSSAPTSRTCPLCTEYIEKDCEGCPIAVKTRIPFCYDTPYDDAWEAWLTSAKYPSTWRKAATAEIRFLRSLLPKKKSKR